MRVKKNGDKTLKWTFGYNIFLTQASVIFIQQKQVLIYWDWHNQLLNVVNK